MSAANVHDGKAVAVVLRVDSREEQALMRAASLAAWRGGELHVLLQLPIPGTTSRMLFPHRSMDAIRVGPEHARQVDDAQAWVLRLAPDARVTVTQGDVSAVASDAMQRLDFELLVVPAPHLERPRDAVRVAAQLGVPVFLARPPAGRTAVVAATDLRQPGFPILRRAVALARRTRGDVTAVYNVPMRVPVAIDPIASSRALLPTPEELRREATRLTSAARGVGMETETVLTSELSTASAVLDAARHKNADVIVVGTRARGWLGRVIFGSIADAVADRAAASVLIVPLLVGTAR